MEPYEDGQQLGKIKNSDIEEGVHVGYTFKKGDAEFIFWITNDKEAFLEGTIEKDGVKKRTSVSTNGGMGLWNINND